jgi:uncharacterized membrane protein/uncharacterized protein (UPF0548 family)
MGEVRRFGNAATRRALDELHDKGLNFDARRRGELTPENGWHVDEYRQPLPAEPPGLPLPDGSWRAAQRLMRDYEFADPSLIRAIYYPDRPLEQRDMLLEGRFLGLRFYFGCRVGGVNDELRMVDARPVQVWGWNYRTLQGHLEMGQMDYEVWKWLDSGAVEFRIHVVSKPAQMSDPVIRLGFRLFGRAMQRRFARHACQRMARLTSDALERRGPREVAEPAPPGAGKLAVRRALLLGVVAGMRSQLPIALLVFESHRGRFDLGRGWLARRLATTRGVTATVLASAAEIVGDKLPVVPSRTRPGPLAARVAIGTLAGAAIYRDAHRPVATGALVGAVAAGGSTLAFARARAALGRRTPLPDPAWGAGEDALAVILGLLAVRSRDSAIGGGPAEGHTC